MSEPVMSPEPYTPSVDRRTTLAWLVAAAGLAPAGVVQAQSPNDRSENHALLGRPAAKGYGTDPRLVSPLPAPWPRLMTREQLQTAAGLCDFILPASATAPSATRVGVPDFIDEWISAPYPQQVADRAVVLDGLAWVEAAARRRGGKALAELSPGERDAVLTPLTARPANAASATPHAFFRRFRSLTIGAYYTTEAGFKDVGYIGNVARPVDPGPSTEVRAAVDAALRRMGL